MTWTPETQQAVKEALEFYSIEKNYYEEIKDHVFRTTIIAEDRGKLAKQALELIRQEEARE